MSDAESIFFAALEKPTSAERNAYVAEACGGDAELRQRVERLLAAAPQLGSFLDQPADAAYTGAYTPDPNASEPPPADALPVGTVVAGRFKLLEQIGEGGMGTVYVAEQTAPVRRKVALKLVKPGMDSRSVLARFEAERQALALMDHPNIAKILDGGLTEQGRPFFVMEYIKGVPLTDYCDKARLSVRQRLGLFAAVCQAVQHAHQKGIIHRDLKPSNVLVALYDDKPVPKVIDFGLAKAMHQPLTERSLYTGHQQVLGTPLYMSPEQSELNNLDVDTRTDIYSLGVILYELLTGTTPLDRQRFRQAAWEEMLRLIREEEPPKPSTRLSTSDALPSVAASRQTEPAKLSKLVRGELDWIVMKALEKDRGRRYETASGFAMDVQRYLADEPVLAGPPGVRYRLRKFVRRNKRQVVAAALVLLSLVAGIAATTWQVAERRREREVARLRSSQASLSALDRAEAALAANRLPDADAALALIDPMSLADDVAERYRTVARDRDTAREMEEIYEDYWTAACSHITQHDADRAKARYPEAFRRYDITVNEEATKAVADRIQRSRVTAALADGLAMWFFLEPTVPGLRALIDQVDPDEFRTAVRAAAAAADQGRLRQLAAKADGAVLPPVFAVMLANRAVNEDSHRILRAAWDRRPDSFAVALALRDHPSPTAQDRDTETLGWCRAAMALRPNSALAHVYLGLALEEIGDRAGQVKALRRAVELAPQLANVHAQLGMALAYSDQGDEAIRCCRKALELDSQNLTGHAVLAFCFVQRNDWVLAAVHCRALARLGKLEPADELCAAAGTQAVLASGSGRKIVDGVMGLQRFAAVTELFEDARRSDYDQYFTDRSPVGAKWLTASCAAVQAAAGRGVDPPRPEDRPRIRRLALEWLLIDLKALDEALSNGDDGTRSAVHECVMRWVNEPLLADVRGDRIAELPKNEHDEWRRFWADATKLCDRSAPAGPAKP